MRIFRMLIECLTPLHCGGGEEDPLQDQPVSRDAFGLWRIPGSSLAGALRSLSERIDSALTATMFGEREAGGQRPSLIWCEDALLLDWDGETALAKKLAGRPVAIPLGPFVRDHVALDLQTGSAVRGGKFDAEIVPPGARFLISLRCDGWNRQLACEEKAHFDRLCALLNSGALDLGGKTANGYGRYRCLEAQYRELNLENPQDMEMWLNLTTGAMLKPGEGRDLPLGANAAEMGGQGLHGHVDLELVCDAPILIGGGDPGTGRARPSEADLVFALSPWLDYENGRLDWRPVLPGSAIKGVLRHAAYNILRDRGLDAQRSRARLDSLFGHIGNEANGEGQRGKLVVEDCPLPARSTSQFIQHVALDRFTGGAREGALFSEEPYWLPDLEIPLRLQVREANAAEAGLIFQTLLDLGDGLLSIGSGGNRGNGRLKARAGAGAREFLGTLRGDLAWNAEPVLHGDPAGRLENLRFLARQWDAAMEAWQ
ncbi:MAG: hypothetical protein HDQ91_04760 [Desulfovibrio sp.]|nr:hypothetical protein [Desulfovibrio sp.]